MDAVNGTSHVNEVDYKSPDCQKGDADLTIGVSTKRYLESIEEEITNADIDNFYK
jgi:hypothetical protein